MNRHSLLAMGCISLLALSVSAIAPPASAQAQPVNGFSLTRVSLAAGSGTESFEQTGAGQWSHLDGEGGLIATYVEVGRDENSVYLQARPGNATIQIDLHVGSVIRQMPGGPRETVGPITARSAEPSVRRAASPPQAAPQPDAAAEGRGADFNPFADADGGASPAATPASSTAKAAGSQASSVPPWLRNQPAGQQGGAADNASARPVPAAGASFDGPWVEANKQPEASGDGVNRPISWTLPEAIWIAGSGPSSLAIHFDLNPAGSVTLSKTSENHYAGAGYTAVFSPLGSRYRLSLSGGGRSRTFDMSTTVERDLLSRDRFDPALRTEVENRRSTFTQGGQVKGWNVMFHSFKGEEMDLFSVLRGRKTQIFKQPGPRDIANDDNINKSLVFGLRGQPTLNSSSQQLETIVTNMSSYQKSMSYNFGGGGGAKGASLGINVSREETRGSESSSESSRAYGLGRVETFVLWLDKPNIELDPGFKDDISRLASGAMSPATFRATYGTHYAAAVHFGGIGEATRTVTSKEMRDFVSQSTSIGADASVKAVQLKGGFTDASSSSSGSKSMFAQSSWRATGGAGSMTESGWTVNEDNSVPIRYDLRPLSDLVSPLFFAAEWNTSARGGLLSARQQLDSEISRYMASQPPLPDRMTGPAVYKLTFHSIKCIRNGDEGTAPAELYGKISAVVAGLEGQETVSLLNAPEGSPKTVSCNGGAELPINHTMLVTGTRDGSRPAYFMLATDGLFENDNSFTDLDDALVAFPPVPVLLKDWRADQSRTDLQGTAISNPPTITAGPDLRVRVSFQPVQ